MTKRTLPTNTCSKCGQSMGLSHKCGLEQDVEISSNMSKCIEYSEEVNDKCPRCKTPVMLLTSGALVWSCDEEPYESGESIDDIKDKTLKAYAEKAYEGIEFDEEITLHYCPKCEKITSVCVRW